MLTAKVARLVFATTLIAFGIAGLYKPDFVPVWEPIPQGMRALSFLCSVISVICGLGLLWHRSSAAAARVLLGYFLLWLILLRVPGVLLERTVDFWWSACQVAVMVAAAWVVYVWSATDWDRSHVNFATGDNGLHIARLLYGVALIPFGIAHFLYLQHTAELVPGWVPWHVFWAYFTGCALIAAGLSVLIGVYARLAAALSALELGILTLLVWIPVVAAGSKDAFQWSETVVSIALTSAAWLVAESYRGVPWLSARRSAPAIRQNGAIAGRFTR